MEKNFVFRCYTYENGRHNGFIIVEGLKKLAEFIVSNENDKVITDIGDRLIIKTIGSFLDVVPDKEFRNEFLPYLLKAQSYEDNDEDIHYEQGKCPVCGSDNLDYGVADFEGNQMYYPTTCNDCHATFEEWYTLEFSFHENIQVEDKKGGKL